VVVAVYLFYRPLPEWWYLRFLLPALPLLIVLAMSAVVFASRRTMVLVPVTLIVVTYAMTSAAMRDAWELMNLERRFRTAGAVARERFDSRAVFMTVWESGSVRYHATREAVLWDSLEPASLDAAVNWLSSTGREPFIMVEEWEEPLFRERFADHSVYGRLDWPPAFDIERRVKVFKPADRARYFGGESVPTEFVWPDRR
jgi:hypothetical protein